MQNEFLLFSRTEDKLTFKVEPDDTSENKNPIPQNRLSSLSSRETDFPSNLKRKPLTSSISQKISEKD